ncbi:MAG: hypothetical protein Q8J88_02630 [Bacteroidales bacterium]|nr:hypothetical protein [Bacteroidales bacterium]
MKKETTHGFRLGIAFLLTSFLLIVWTLSITGEPGGGSNITCYSTFAITGNGECTYLVVDCGTCNEKTCYEYRDALTCKSKQWVWNPPSNN